MRKPVSLLIRFYQRWISPLFPPHCRYSPSCSEYTFEAVQEYGAAKGLFMGLKRLSRCHPFHSGGYDPVPKPTDHQ
ncbi:MAG: membrane protein insertion efficiency factor YidD [Gammaproteobacteria bacterium]|nr:membrane protein insertion efficiency factor YidD [Gammaproteobacteria bacterium]